MRTSVAKVALVVAFVVAAVVELGACHRAPSPPSGQRVAPEPALHDPAKAVAVRDLRDALAATRAAIARHESPVYAADKLALAARELDGEMNAGVMALLAEAETVYGHDAPVAWADAKLAEAAVHPDVRADDCAAARSMLDRVSAKYKDDAPVLALKQRVKGQCPHVRSSHVTPAASNRPPDRAATRDECRRRCDDAAFDCRASCQYCGSCTTDKTWDQCNAICNTCKQGCEQNERFCRSSCGD
jgi:hypothetical protein